MYERALGPAFARLDAPVQRFHRLAGRHELHGHVDVRPPTSQLAWLLAWGLGTPTRAVAGPIRFVLDAQTGSETWERFFPGQVMRSRLRLLDNSGMLEEALGAARLRFVLLEADGKLVMQLRELRFLGIRCPTWLMPRVIAQESGDGDDGERFDFEIEATVPGIGRVAAYRGYLVIG